MSEIGKITDLSADVAANVFGRFDEFARKIEKTLHISFVYRDNELRVIGEEVAVHRAIQVISTLAELAKRGNTVTEQNVDYALSLTYTDSTKDMIELDDTIICRTTKAKTLGQKKYVESIKNNTIVFGLGPAGTGKTYLAMAMAITAFKNDEVSRIILTRPAIEAGENLGFLPGDLQSKVDPYLRPLYDALYQIMGAESYLHNSEKGLIEVAPLAYMRGRTLDNAFIILDEAQNTTPAQMKMFLTRIGFGSKAVITGDLTQKDLPHGAVSGLDMAIKVLQGIDDIDLVTLTNQDVVRHPLVQKIVKAYEDYETKHRKENRENNHRKQREEK